MSNGYRQAKVTRRPDRSERSRFLHIAREVSDRIGTEFFRSMVMQLADPLLADCVYIGEFVGGQFERVKTIAAYLDRQREADFDFQLAGSPAAEVAIGHTCIYADRLQQRFPSDPLLKALNIHACVGVPLNDPNRRSMGLIMVLYRRPVGDLRAAKSMLELFAPRAAAELERQQAYMSFLQSEQRHLAFIARSPDAMWRIEFEVPIPINLPPEQQIDKIYQYGHLAECNDAMARLFGLQTAEQLTGRRFRDLEAPYAPCSRDDLRSAILSQYRLATVETTPLDEAGNRRYLSRSQWGIVENGELLRMWGTIRDVTELSRAKLTAAAAGQRLKSTLENLHLIAVILDCQGLISYCNDYLLQLTGWQAAEITGRNWFDVMVPEEDRERLRSAFKSACDGSTLPSHYESTLLGRDKRQWLVAWDSTVLRDASGCFNGSANIGCDITEYKAIEAHLHHAQRLESMGRLTGRVAHDFNNLLSLILGYTGMLLARMDTLDPTYHALSEIKRTAEKGAALTYQLLTFSRRQRLHPKLLNLSSLIADYKNMLGRLIREDIELKLELEPFPGLVCADASQIKQLLLSLVLNACDAMPNGGRLTIASSNVRLHDCDIQSYPGMSAGSHVLLTISDTGVGMSAEVRAHLFEPFFTTKEQGKGTGLGLSTVYGIVQQNSGYIVAKSEPDKGTTFKMFLPVTATPAEPLTSRMTDATDSR